MTDLRKAAEMALEALERSMEAGLTGVKVDEAITALRQALNVDPIDTPSTCVDENEKREHEPVAWTQVSDGLPRSGITVLACYKNRLGNLRRIRAHWVAAKTIEASVDYGECYEYDEETDEDYLLEGWYECIDNWDEYSSVAVCEGEVTHWMPLPPAPDEEYTDPPSKPEKGCAECGKKASDGWALYCVKCSEPMREQEPVAWTLTEFLDKRETTANAPLWFVDPVNSAWTPLYTAPPSVREWVSLTDVELRNAYCEVSGNEWCLGGISNAETFYDAIEAKLKELNHE